MSRSVSAPSSVTNTSPCWNGLIVPGSTFRYGSNFCAETESPRALRRRPSEAATMPFPSAETTPPVTNTYLATGSHRSRGSGGLEQGLAENAVRSLRMDVETRTTRWLRRGVLVLAGFVLLIAGSSVVFWQFRQTVAPYLTASPAMEPTLHCARPRPGCEGDGMDRMFVLRFHPFWTPGRGDIVVFRPPESARLECGIARAFVKRIVGLHGEQVSIRLDRGAA